jgi:hypothetical protein
MFEYLPAPEDREVCQAAEAFVLRCGGNTGIDGCFRVDQVARDTVTRGIRIIAAHDFHGFIEGINYGPS